MRLWQRGGGPSAGPPQAVSSRTGSRVGGPLCLPPHPAPPPPQRRRLLRTVVLGSGTSWQSETLSHGLGTLNRGPCRAEPAPGTGPVHLGLHRGLSVRPGPRLACVVLARLEAGCAEVCSQHQWAVRVRHWSLLLGRGTAWGRDFTRQNPIPR